MEIAIIRPNFKVKRSTMDSSSAFGADYYIINWKYSLSCSFSLFSLIFTKCWSKYWDVGSCPYFKERILIRMIFSALHEVSFEPSAVTFRIRGSKKNGIKNYWETRMSSSLTLDSFNTFSFRIGSCSPIDDAKEMLSWCGTTRPRVWMVRK